MLNWRIPAAIAVQISRIIIAPGINVNRPIPLNIQRIKAPRRLNTNNQ